VPLSALEYTLCSKLFTFFRLCSLTCRALWPSTSIDFFIFFLSVLKMTQVDNARFLLNAPVKMNAAPKLHVLFPSANRISSSAQSPEELKKAILDCSGSVTEALKDFNL